MVTQGSDSDDEGFVLLRVVKTLALFAVADAIHNEGRRPQQDRRRPATSEEEKRC